MRPSPKIAKTHKSVQAKSETLRVKTDTGNFTFGNGDSYEGGYRIDFDKHTLVKQGWYLNIYLILVSCHISIISGWLRNDESRMDRLQFIDEGVYITDNFEVYSGKWSDDKFTGEFHIRWS